jgi:hypothetical protein
MLQSANEVDTVTTDAAEEPEDATEQEPYESLFSFLQLQEPTERDNFIFHQSDDDARRLNLIPESWILLDSQSTVSVFKNRKLLSNIRESSTNLRVHTNGGTQVSTQLGTVKNFGDVASQHLVYGCRTQGMPYSYGYFRRRCNECASS